MSEAVGPGHPPRACRFKKGQSGNPTGRPKRKPGAESPSAFDIIVDKTLTVIRNGAPCELTVAEALQHKTYQDALAGNRPARRAILKMVAKREKALQATGNRKGPNVEIRLQSRSAQRRRGAGHPRHSLPRSIHARTRSAIRPPVARALGGADGAEPPWWRATIDAQGGRRDQALHPQRRYAALATGGG